MKIKLETTELTKFANFVMFQTATGKANIDVFFADETLWLTQKKIALLFETTPQNITIHLKNIFMTTELLEKATCKDFLQVQQEGNREVSRQFKYYNLSDYVSDFDKQIKQISKKNER